MGFLADWVGLSYLICKKKRHGSQLAADGDSDGHRTPELTVGGYSLSWWPEEALMVRGAPGVAGSKTGWPDPGPRSWPSLGTFSLTLNLIGPVSQNVIFTWVSEWKILFTNC